MFSLLSVHQYKYVDSGEKGGFRLKDSSLNILFIEGLQIRRGRIVSTGFGECFERNRSNMDLTQTKMASAPSSSK